VEQSILLHGRQKAQKGEGTGDPVKPSKKHPSDLLLPSRPHLPKSPQPLKIAPPAGDKPFNIWACGEHLYSNHNFPPPPKGGQYGHLILQNAFSPSPIAPRVLTVSALFKSPNSVLSLRPKANS
jgi:hypothetical protein